MEKDSDRGRNSRKHVTAEFVVSEVEASCLRMLSGKTDEEKIAGLLLAAKHLIHPPSSSSPPPPSPSRGCSPGKRREDGKGKQEGKQSSSDVRCRIFKAAGRTFFARLLRTESTRHVALAVLASLSEDVDVSKAMQKKLVPKMWTYLRDVANGANRRRGEKKKVTEAFVEEQFKSLADTIRCISNVSVHCESATCSRTTYVCVLLNLLWALRPACRGPKEKETTSREARREGKTDVDSRSLLSQRASSLLLDLLRRSFCKHSSTGDSSAIDRVDSSSSSLCSLRSNPSICRFRLAVHVFRNFEPPTQWTVLAALPLVLRSCQEEEEEEEEEEEGHIGGDRSKVESAVIDTSSMQWETALRNGLLSVWVVKQLPRQLRSITFQLAIMTSVAFEIARGTPWYVEREDEDGGDDERAKRRYPGRFFQLWISLAANELKMIVDDAIDSIDPTTLQLAAKSEKSIGNEISSNESATLLRTLEFATSALCRDDAESVSESISSTSLLSLLRTLRQSAEMIAGFLGVALKAMENWPRMESKVVVSRRDAIERTVVQCLRMIGMYLVVDTDEDVHAKFASTLSALCVWNPVNREIRECFPIQYALPVLEHALLTGDDGAMSASISAPSVSRTLFETLMSMTTDLSTAPACAAARVASLLVLRAGETHPSLRKALTKRFEEHWSSRVAVGRCDADAREIAEEISRLAAACHGSGGRGG